MNQSTDTLHAELQTPCTPRSAGLQTPYTPPQCRGTDTLHPTQCRGIDTLHPTQYRGTAAVETHLVLEVPVQFIPLLLECFHGNVVGLLQLCLLS